MRAPRYCLLTLPSTLYLIAAIPYRCYYCYYYYYRYVTTTITATTIYYCHYYITTTTITTATAIDFNLRDIELVVAYMATGYNTAYSLVKLVKP